MEKRVFAFRGAVCVDNTEESITNNVCLLCNELFAHNQLQADDVISLQFSITDDITVLNPATALRRGKTTFDSSQIPLFCTQEAKIEGGMKQVVRVLLTAYADSTIERYNIYLNGAENLRKDLIKK